MNASSVSNTLLLVIGSTSKSVPPFVYFLPDQFARLIHCGIEGRKKLFEKQITSPFGEAADLQRKRFKLSDTKKSLQLSFGWLQETDFNSSAVSGLLDTKIPDA